jgi:hypothetical protein
MAPKRAATLADLAKAKGWTVDYAPPKPGQVRKHRRPQRATMPLLVRSTVNAPTSFSLSRPFLGVVGRT